MSKQRVINKITYFAPTPVSYFPQQIKHSGCIICLQKYEEEISQMEKMRGMDVKFINPEVKHWLQIISGGIKMISIVKSNSGWKN